MKRFDKYLSIAFAVASACLAAYIMLRQFLVRTPGEYSLGPGMYLLMWLANISLVVVLIGAPILFMIKIFRKPRRLKSDPVFVGILTLFAGVFLILLHGLYVKLKTCTVGVSDTAWHCNVSGWLYIDMLMWVFVLMALASLLAWLMREMLKRW